MSPTRPRALLPDAMIIIALHELCLWEAICGAVDVVVPSIVLHDEARYYVDRATGMRREIDLRNLAKEGAVREVAATPAEMAQFLARFDTVLGEQLHEGELEALTVLALGKVRDCAFCTSDTRAIDALVLVGLDGRGISLESVLQSCGRTVRDLATQYTEAHFRRVLTQARVRRMQGTGLAQR